jgi:hypothetical protein
LRPQRRQQARNAKPCGTQSDNPDRERIERGACVPSRIQQCSEHDDRDGMLIVVQDRNWQA